MEPDQSEQIAIHRFSVIAEATNERLTKAERGAIVRAIAERTQQHPDGTQRRYSRSSIDRWIRAWRKDGLAGLRPGPRSDTGAVRAHPELFAEACALRLELPTVERPCRSTSVPLQSCLSRVLLLPGQTENRAGNST